MPPPEPDMITGLLVYLKLEPSVNYIYRKQNISQDGRQKSSRQNEGEMLVMDTLVSLPYTDKDCENKSFETKSRDGTPRLLRRSDRINNLRVLIENNENKLCLVCTG